MLEEIVAPWPFRLAASVGRCLTEAGVPLFPLEPERLIRKARRHAGLTDLGDDALFREALEQLCLSAQEKGALHDLGRVAVHDMIVAALVNRLLWVEARRRDAARLRTPLRTPLLVVGFARAGTTLLHRLLALAPAARPLRTWEVQFPLPPVQGRDKRRAIVAAQIRNIDWIAPSFAIKHPMQLEDAEEDFWLLNPSLMSPTFYVFAPLHSYGAWHRAQNNAAAYTLWASLLSSFQADSPGQRLTLKAPAHTGFVREAITAVPNLAVVHIHRDPVPIVGSLNSLSHTLLSLVSDAPDPVALGRQNLELLRWHGERNREARKTVSDHILDVSYKALLDDPAGMVEHIHRHFELPFEPTHRDRITRYVQEHSQHQHGRHTYDLAECGLTEAEVHEALDLFTTHIAPQPLSSQTRP